MKFTFSLCLLLLSASAFAQTRPTLRFTPESDKFNEATKQYESLWASEGDKIIKALESAAGLKFADKEVNVIVYEGVSWSGYREKPMKLRASYPADVKKATLVHELGHRLLSELFLPLGLDNHRALFLVLYDVWVKLYGKEFAEQNVVVESRRKGLYDYETAWKWALALTEQERAAKFKELVRNQPPR